MFSFLYNTFFYNPLYNGLVFFIDILPTADVGLAVVLLTLVVKLLLFPLSQKAIETQIKLKGVQAEIDEIKKLYKDNKEEQAKAIMEVYRKHKVNPFAGFLTLLIQIPLVLALYFIFAKGGLPMIRAELLYSFISIPDSPNMLFLGLISMSERSVLLAVLVGISQFFQAKLSFAEMPMFNEKPKSGAGPSFKTDLMKGMQLQMRYILPIIMTVFSLSLIAVVPLYWFVGNLFMIGQEIYFRKIRLRNEKI